MDYTFLGYKSASSMGKEYTNPVMLLITATIISVKCSFSDNTDIPTELLLLITQLCGAD